MAHEKVHRSSLILGGREHLPMCALEYHGATENIGKECTSITVEKYISQKQVTQLCSLQNISSPPFYICLWKDAQANVRSDCLCMVEFRGDTDLSLFLS